MNYLFSFLLPFLIISSLPAKENGSWLIYHNNIKILRGEDHPLSDNKYILNIDKKSLDSTGSLKVEYSDNQSTPKEENGHA